MIFYESLKQKIELYLEGKISIRELNKWLAVNGWDIHKWCTQEEMDMYGSASLLIYEYKTWTLKEFKEKMAEIIGKNPKA